MTFLNPLADPLWGQPCLAIHVQPHLTAQAQQELHRVQQQAAAAWPGALRCAPPDALHVTVYPLVPVLGTFDREAYWGEIADRSLAIVQDLGAGAGPLTLRFTRLKVTNVAVIAVAQDETGLIEAIRHRIVEMLPPPPDREPMRYDLIHSTLARHADTAPVPASAVERVEAMSVSVSVRVERLKIFRETVYPCLVGDELASVPLG